MVNWLICISPIRKFCCLFVDAVGPKAIAAPEVEPVRRAPEFGSSLLPEAIARPAIRVATLLPRSVLRVSPFIVLFFRFQVGEFSWSLMKEVG